MARPPADEVFAIIEQARPQLVALEVAKLNHDRYVSQAQEYTSAAKEAAEEIGRIMESLNVVADELVALYAKSAEEVPPGEVVPVEVEGGARK